MQAALINITGHAYIDVKAGWELAGEKKGFSRGGGMTESNRLRMSKVHHIHI